MVRYLLSKNSQLDNISLYPLYEGGFSTLALLNISIGDVLIAQVACSRSNIAIYMLNTSNMDTIYSIVTASTFYYDYYAYSYDAANYSGYLYCSHTLDYYLCTCHDRFPASFVQVSRFCSTPTTSLYSLCYASADSKNA